LLLKGWATTNPANLLLQNESNLLPLLLLQVLLRFAPRFHDLIFLPGRPFNVRFAIKRTSFVFMHEALEVAERGLAASAAAGARPELLLPPPTASAVPGKPLTVRVWGFNDCDVVS
jgi:hypothetical protein